jgi:16S rRNA (cytosine967-C5)-methyltransferase
MSLSSAIAVNYYRAGIENSGKILDVCAAPGGKSVYLSELGDYDITACDVHPHRVKLIDSYARTMGAKIKTVTNDATVHNTEWQDKFDAVICDVPCSGIGVRSSKPDVFLNRKQEDIAAIVETQRKILDVSSYYVRSGGTLFYSTCTILKRENDEVVGDFLSTHPQFELLPLKAGNYKSGKDGFLRLLPDGKGLEGFFVAAFKRK